MSTGTSIVVAEKSHSELGASVAKRWMECPGSVQLTRGMPNESSIFAEEGTAAHALAELCLRKGVAPDFYVGTTIEGIEVTDEMAEHVAVYVNHCLVFDDLVMATFIEKKFTLGALHPPGPMFGTADFVAYDERDRTLHIVDLKYGQGVVVEAKGNPQLRYYALGAALSMEQGTAIEQVVMTIVQPRALHPDGPIRSETITFQELVDFAGELMAAAKRTTEPNAPLKVGDWCRFCPAAAVCPARREAAQELAQIEFATIETIGPPAPESLPPEMIADMLSKAPILEDWLKSLRAHAYNLMERGEPLPGFKLVQKRATRAWADEETALQVLTGDGTWTKDDLTTSELKSPAQVEKLIGKKNVPQDLIVKKSSGVKMVPVHHPGKAVELTAGSEFFPALPPGEDE